MYLRGNLQVRSASQRKSLRKLNLRPLASPLASPFGKGFTVSVPRIMALDTNRKWTEQGAVSSSVNTVSELSIALYAIWDCLTSLYVKANS